MRDVSLCSLTGKMECPGLLSKGDLNPFHHHCPVHSQSYKLSVVGGLCGVLLWKNLIREWDNRWATASSNAWATSFNSSSKLRNSIRCPHLGIYRRKKQGKTTRLFPFPLFCCFCISHGFFVLFCFVSVLCAGSQI